MQIMMERLTGPGLPGNPRGNVRLSDGVEAQQLGRIGLAVARTPCQEYRAKPKLLRAIARIWDLAGQEAEYEDLKAYIEQLLMNNSDPIVL